MLDILPPRRARVPGRIGWRPWLRYRRQWLASACDCFLRWHASQFGIATVSRRGAGTDLAEHQLRTARCRELGLADSAAWASRQSARRCSRLHVGPQYGAPSFNVDENGDQQQEIIWSDELPPELLPHRIPTLLKRRYRLQTSMTWPRQLRRRFPAGPTSSGPCCRGCRPYSLRAPSDPARSTRHLVRPRQRHPVSTRDGLLAHLHNRWPSKRAGTSCCSDRRTSGRTHPRTEFCER